MRLDRKDDIEEDIVEDDDDDLGDLPEDDGINDYDDFGMNDINDVPSTMEKHRDLLMQLTDFDPSLKDMVNGWLGLVYSEKEEKYIQTHKPIMNHDCAAWCVTFMKNYAKRTNLITHLDEKTYQWIISDVIEVVWYNIGTRAEEFGIESNGDIFRICNEIEHSAELVLIGAGGGKYNLFFGTTTQRSEHITQQPMQNYNNQQMPQLMRPEQIKKPGLFQRMGNAIKGSDV